MAQIYELETKTGRIFKVSIENKNQLQRLRSSISNAKGTVEEVTSFNCLVNGVQTIKSFEELFN